jgi:flagellar biogenesis protein FliO
MAVRNGDNPGSGSVPTGGWAGWLAAKLRKTARPQPRLRLLERIAIAPRQSLALVEAEGRRFLLATSADAAPAFYAIEEPARTSGSVRTTGAVYARKSRGAHPDCASAARISW